MTRTTGGWVLPLDPSEQTPEILSRSLEWPGTFETEIEIGRRLVEELVEVLRDDLTAPGESGRLLACLSAKFMIEVCSLIRAHRLVDGLRRQGIDVEPPPQMGLVSAVTEGRSPPASAFLESLEVGVEQPAWWRRRLRRPREAFRQSPYRARSLRGISANEVVTTTRCPLTAAHARRDSLRPIIVPCSEWCYPPTTVERGDGMPMGAEQGSIERLVEAIVRVAEQSDVRLPEHDVAWLQAWLRSGSRWIAFYRRRLRGLPTPSELWTGSSGIIWTRLLGDATVENGGRLVVHDHALGADYSERSLMPFVETYRASTWFTFTPRQADLYRRLIPYQSLASPRPEVDSLAFRPVSMVTTRSRRTIRRLCYVVPMYPTDINGPQALTSSVPAVRWQARLFAALSKNSVDILTKPHPLSPFRMPKWLLERYGVTELAGRFEKVVGVADAILFDNPMTTTFGHALRTDQPVILIDFGQAWWTDEVREMLAARCSLVPGCYDNDGFPNVDAERLAQALREAPELTDHSYVAEILGPELTNP